MIENERSNERHELEKRHVSKGDRRDLQFRFELTNQSTNCEKKQRVTREKRKTIKLTRAQGGCLGTKSRRRTWQAAKSHDEPQAGD